jgi:hypothetical protein
MFMPSIPFIEITLLTYMNIKIKIEDLVSDLLMTSNYGYNWISLSLRKVILNAVPNPGSLWTAIVPPNARITWYENVNPKPVPRVFVE